MPTYTYKMSSEIACKLVSQTEPMFYNDHECII